MYNFFIDGLQLPVAPSQMKTRINNKNETVTLMNDGEVNVLKKPGLTDIEFEVLLPNVKYPFAVYPDGFKPATHYLEMLEQLKVNQESFQFIVNRMIPNGSLLFDTNMMVSLEDYEIVEDAEENGFDIVVVVNLKQYRAYGNKKINIQKETATSTSTASTTKKATVEKPRSTANKPTTPKTHKVVSGDTLWAICKKYYGTASKSMTDELAAKNGIKNPNKIFVGQVIKL